jgi:hypothetical protein
MQECEATGKQDATLWRLTSPATPAILVEVLDAAVGGSTPLGRVWDLANDSRLSL